MNTQINKLQEQLNKEFKNDIYFYKDEFIEKNDEALKQLNISFQYGFYALKYDSKFCVSLKIKILLLNSMLFKKTYLKQKD